MELVGSPNSAAVVASALESFQVSLSPASFWLFFRTNRLFCALRQPSEGVAGQVASFSQAEQPSPSRTLPSSHCSPGSTEPLPAPASGRIEDGAHCTITSEDTAIYLLGVPKSAGLSLSSGLNLTSLSTSIAPPFDSVFDWLDDIGTDAVIQSYDRRTGRYVSAARKDGELLGENFDLALKDAYLVHLNVAVNRPEYVLHAGLNVVSPPHPDTVQEPGLSAYELLERLGGRRWCQA